MMSTHPTHLRIGSGKSNRLSDYILDPIISGGLTSVDLNKISTPVTRKSSLHL